MVKPVVLISIKARWVELILSGRKTVELRKKAPDLRRPTAALIYQSGPGGCLRAARKMGPVISDKPERLWGALGRGPAFRAGNSTPTSRAGT